jgi:hypothetical protein
MVLAFCFHALENLGALNDIKLEMYLLSYPKTLTVSTNAKRKRFQLILLKVQGLF